MLTSNGLFIVKRYKQGEYITVGNTLYIKHEDTLFVVRNEKDIESHYCCDNCVYEIEDEDGYTTCDHPLGSKCYADHCFYVRKERL